MLNDVKGWLRQLTELFLVLIALGIVLQVLFPRALVFINADVAGNLIALVNQFHGAGLVGLIAVGIFIYLLRRA
jgi:hypothetical protein